MTKDRTGGRYCGWEGRSWCNGGLPLFEERVGSGSCKALGSELDIRR